MPILSTTYLQQLQHIVFMIKPFLLTLDQTLLLSWLVPPMHLATRTTSFVAGPRYESV